MKPEQLIYRNCWPAPLQSQHTATEYMARKYVNPLRLEHMAQILWTKFSNAFFARTYVIWYKFHRHLFPTLWLISPLDKMDATLADANLKCIFLNQNDKIPILFSQKFVSRSTIDNKPALVQVMAWRRTGDKPLPESILTQFADAYMRH